MSLDDKLREMAIEQPPCTHCGAVDFTNLPDSAIDQIKKCFADEGYVQNGNVGHTINGAVVMQGQEFYDRFYKELQATRTSVDSWTGTHIAEPIVLEAAKKAAGIE